MAMYDISDRAIDDFFGEYERPTRWPYCDEDLDFFEEDEYDGDFGL